MKMKASFKCLVAALMLTAATWIVTPADAAPISYSIGLQNAVPTSVDTVRYRRGWGYVARPYYYRPYPYYYYRPYAYRYYRYY